MMQKPTKLIFIIMLLSIILSSCGAGLQVDYSKNDSSLAYADQQGSAENIQYIQATATPFMPMAPTPTPIPTATPTPNPTTPPTATVDPNRPYVTATAFLPEELEEYPAPPNLTNILLLGSDVRPERDSTFRTDVMLLVTINTVTETVSVTSFPRDMWVTLPNYGANRLNSAFYLGGWDLMAATFEYNFGVRPEYYAMIDFSGFIDIIDTIQGIDVKVEKQLRDQRDGYGYFKVNPGTVHMDGEMALWYVRSRYSTNDIDRGRRQTEVITGFFQTLVSVDALEQAKEVYDIFVKSLQTNMKFSDIAPLLPFAYTIYLSENVDRYSIDYTYLSDFTTYDGRMVLWPDLAGIRNLIKSIQNN
jgi:LCP family protein required for cell wall assembly